MTIHSGRLPGVDERFQQLQALGQSLDLGVGVGRRDLVAHPRDLVLEVHGLEQLVDGLGAHAGIELVTVLLDGVQVGLVGEQLAALQRRHAWIDDHEGLEIQDPLDFAQRHVQHEPDARRQRLQEPDMRHRRGELDVAHALAAYLGLGDLDAALLAHHTAVLEALVLAAQALVVLDRSEDLGAEQSVALRLEGPVVDRLRLLHLAVGPAADHVRRGQTDADGIEVLDRGLLLEKLQ
jgi:hypothetical protein